MCTEGVQKRFPEGNVRNRTTASRPSPEFPPACRACGSQEDVLTVCADCDFTKREDLQCSNHSREFCRVVCLPEVYRYICRDADVRMREDAISCYPAHTFRFGG